MKSLARDRAQVGRGSRDDTKSLLQCSPAFSKLFVARIAYGRPSPIRQLEAANSMSPLHGSHPLSMGIENGTLPGIENGTLPQGLEIGTRHPGSRGGSGATGAGAGVLGRWIVMTASRSGLARR